MRVGRHCLVWLTALAACTSADDADPRDTHPDSAASVVVASLSNSAGLRARLDQIDAAIETKRRELAVPGAAVAIVTADRVLLSKGFGLRDVSAALPVTSTTRFAIGSCTKPFTALAAVIAADEGVLSLDDSPRKYLPYFHLRDANADSQVTLRDLLSHRTGVPDDLGGGWFERYGTTERLIRVAMMSAPRGAFRRVFHYNNYLFSAAGEAVATARGTTYQRVVRDGIFKPVGMRRSSLSLDEMHASDEFAFGYEDSARKRVQPTRLAYLSAIAPAGNINSNAEDMARWLRMLVGGGVLDGRRVVSDSGFRAMLTPAVKTGGGHYALGWFVEEWHGLRLYSHPGGVTGYGTRCEFLPDARIGWVVLTNVDDQALPKAVREIIYERLLQ